MSFSPSRHPNLNNFIRSLLLSEEQLVAFQTALADDQALQPSITPTATSRQDFDRLEQEVKHLTTTLRVSNKAPVTTSHQRSYEIKFALSHGARATIDDKTNAEIVQKISSKGAPFNQVVACRLERTALVLMVTNPEAEAALHLQQHMIGPMLEVPKEDCTLLAQSYQVQIVNLGSRAKVQFKQPMDFITAWGRRNRVIIKDARWTYKKLIWTLDRLGDAQKLVHAKGVVLSGHMAYAKAYDKRSSPKQCFTCGRAINESRKHAERKVFWEFFPLVDDDPTVDTLPKVSKGDAQELSLASVAEPDVSRAETSIQYDTELDSQLPFPDSQESFELSNEGDMDMDEYLSQDVASDLEFIASLHARRVTESRGYPKGFCHTFKGILAAAHSYPSAGFYNHAFNTAVVWK
ncbi:uncharacterized protein J4E88_000106 [Alternaria novae-zelandiae]|uniref:uncharacterized protein n=1 Tax=Alternaria novae-zelandiae TaxID=430562 RepID=UPI0020C2969F|nr:uncharacterized protein J4E88_000106 [Alternaria novae-zelandiae]KAI4695936.1 hypothetical protein J4E88_000106 [Alternaria novae-zelandiae]